MKALKINTEDNVAVLLSDVRKGEIIELPGGDAIETIEDISRGHKVSLTEIKVGEPIIKYGNVIGSATQDIHSGSWVHTHNVRTGLSGIIEYTYEPDVS
ncbi:MAG: UxaA family hydrolase, partial [Eubacterium sp.]|nr:UxaA family hydrolase [Eubacterium sp.]